MRDRFRQKKKQNAENDVNGEKLNAFDPVGFAVAADLKQDVNRSDYGEDFRPRKLEVHRLTKQIGDEYQQRRDKERDLQARSNRNPNAQIHFVFQRHENGGRVLGGVADNRDDDDADESLGDAERRAYALDCADQNSASSATNPVTTSRIMIALPRDQYSLFSSSSPSMP